jgi:hypothetical protein
MNDDPLAVFGARPPRIVGPKQRGPDEASAGASKRSAHLEFGSFSGLAPRGRNLPERRFRGVCPRPALQRVDYTTMCRGAGR